jgi:hypothetical protein
VALALISTSAILDTGIAAVAFGIVLYPVAGFRLFQLSSRTYIASAFLQWQLTSQQAAKFIVMVFVIGLTNVSSPRRTSKLLFDNN